MKRNLILIFLVLTVISASAITEFDKHISNAKIYYENGEFDKVIVELKEAMGIAEKTNEKGMIDAYQYLAFSYVAYNDFDKAEDLFFNIFQLQEDYSLDRDTTSPKILGVYDKAKVRYMKWKKGEEKKRQKDKDKNKQKNNVIEKSKDKNDKDKDKDKGNDRDKEKDKDKAEKEKGKDKEHADKGKGKEKGKKEKKDKNDNWKKGHYVQGERNYEPGKKYKDQAQEKGTLKGFDGEINPNTRIQGTMPTKFNAAWRSALVPGWGQLYKGSSVKGWIFIGSTLLLDLMHLGAYSEANSLYNDYNAQAEVGWESAQQETDMANAFNDAKKGLKTIRGLHIIFWSYNMIDASFLGWNKIKMQYRTDSRGNDLLVMEYKF